MKRSLPRRNFLKSTSAMVALGLFPRTMFAGSVNLHRVNEKLRTAHIGVGGMGRSDLGSIASHPRVEVAALCDVDAHCLKEASARHGKAQTFTDFREMLSQLDDKIDAVIVSTPDHTHAAAAMTAMNLNKPVYCQKPLTHEVLESRQLRIIADEKKLVTQMGIQIHSHVIYRKAVEIIRSGAIGKVSKVVAWSNKNWGFDGESLPVAAAVPGFLDFDLWLGTAAERPFVPGVYHPANWRKLVDFGTGTLGDMGVHIFDTPYAALELTAPKWVNTSCRPPTGIGHPSKNIVEYEFPGTKYTTDVLRWIWCDGSFAPPSTTGLGLPEGMKFPGQGSLFVGEGGTMLLPHIADAQLFPEKKFADYKRPDVSANDHYHQFVDACLGNGQTSAPFSYGGPLTEALLLGVVANRFPEQKLHWDANQMLITNIAEANALLRREYRVGFEVEHLTENARQKAGVPVP
jgi:predicted dehydrogenase